MSDTQPPLEFFLTSSDTGLQSFELSRMNRASNLRKELRQVMEEWIQAEVNARFARWVLESRRPQALACRADLLTAGDAQPARSPVSSIEQLSISFLPAHEGPIGPVPDPVPGSLPSPELPSPSQASSAETITATSGSVHGRMAISENVAPTPAALPPMSAEAVAAAEAITEDDEGNPRGDPTLDVDALPVDAGVVATTPAAGNAMTRTATALSSQPSETPDESTRNEPDGEIRGEPASALDRCAQQSVAVLHRPRRAASRLGRAVPAREAACGSCATLLPHDGILASATAPGSRACVRAVA